MLENVEKERKKYLAMCLVKNEKENIALLMNCFDKIIQASSMSAANLSSIDFCDSISKFLKVECRKRFLFGEKFENGNKKMLFNFKP